MLEAIRRVRVPGDHPSLAGHFPGRPIVPGVLILELVLDALRVAIGPAHVTCVRAVKFAAPLAPDEDADLRLQWDGRTLRFDCERDGTPIAQGTLEYSAP